LLPEVVIFKFCLNCIISDTNQSNQSATKFPLTSPIKNPIIILQ
jgi:hypothetical protein